MHRTTAIERLLELTGERGRIELDVGFALRNGVYPAVLVRQLEACSRLLHVKGADLDGGEPPPPGEGDLDAGIHVEGAEVVGIERLICEYEGEEVIETLEPTANLLAEYT